MTLTLILLFVACQEQKLIIPTTPTGSNLDETDTGTTPTDSGTTTEVDDAYWSGAQLRIISPESGDFLNLGEDAEFVAEVVDADGEPTGLDDITWQSDVDTAWSLTGGDVTDASLTVGTHALTAQALLPNGDRLSYTVGGVLVQSPYAGIYTGTLLINIAYDTYAVGCSGATTLVVNAEGELVEGDASCTLSFSGYELSPAFVVELANSDGLLEGETAMDLVFIEYPLSTDGSLSEDGDLLAIFSQEIELYGTVAVDGEINAVRVSRDVSGL